MSSWTLVLDTLPKVEGVSRHWCGTATCLGLAARDWQALVDFSEFSIGLACDGKSSLRVKLTIGGISREAVVLDNVLIDCLASVPWENSSLVTTPHHIVDSRYVSALDPLT